MMHSILVEKGNPALRQIAHDIPMSDIGSNRIQNLIREMKALLDKEEYGVALAAPQVGERLRLFVVSGRALARDSRNSPDLSKSEAIRDKSQSFSAPDEPLQQAQGKPTKETDLSRAELRDQIYINPIMSKMSRNKKGKHEGCLSIRGKWGIVSRAEKATVRAYDQTGKQFTRGASGFLAHVFQHEIDHLDGILYTDKATKLYDETKDTKHD